MDANGFGAGSSASAPIGEGARRMSVARIGVDRHVARAPSPDTPFASTEELAQRLGERRWDVVLIDLADGSVGTLSAGGDRRWSW